MIIFEKNNLRISILTPRLLRTELGSFTDKPTQTVVNRDLGEVKCSVLENEKYVVITTDEVFFRVKKSNGNVVYAAFDGGYTKSFGKHPLPGTARTLDTANGAVKLSFA